MTKQIDFANELRTTIWRTMGARFNAVRRLRRRNRLSSFSIAAFAAVGIALTIVQKVYGVPAGTYLDNHYTFLAVAISLFVLVISLLEGAGAYDLKAERLHQNAAELNALQKHLAHLISRAEDGEPLKPEILEKISTEYEEKIKRCPENHERVDDLLFQAQHRHSPEFQRAPISCFGALRIRFIHVLYSIWLFVIAWTVIAVLILVLAGKLGSL